MKILTIASGGVLAFLLSIQQVFAGIPAGCIPSETGGPPICPNGAIPEMDGTGAILAIALVAGIVALVREKFFHK